MQSHSLIRFLLRIRSTHYFEHTDINSFHDDMIHSVRLCGCDRKQITFPRGTRYSFLYGFVDKLWFVFNRNDTHEWIRTYICRPFIIRFWSCFCLISPVDDFLFSLASSRLTHSLSVSLSQSFISFMFVILFSHFISFHLHNSTIVYCL